MAIKKPARKRKADFPRGWLKKELDAAVSEVAKWPEGMRRGVDMKPAVKRARKRKAAKPVMAWGGYYDGKLARTFSYFQGLRAGRAKYAIYDTKAEARANYDDVRRVQIIEVRR